MPSESLLDEERAVLARVTAENDELRVKAERLAALVEETVDLTGFGTVDGVPLYMNAKGLALLGQASIESMRASGIRMRELFAESDRSAYDAGAGHALAHGAWDGELHLKCGPGSQSGAGEEVPVWLTIFTLKDRPSGGVSALAIVARDIRRQKNDARTLRELTAELERRVDARTRELEEKNRELEAFSYSVSHDLRAPIRHISGFADLLERNYKEHIDARGVHYLQTIALAAKQAGTLIDDLLAFSRVARTELLVRDVDLNQLVASCRRDAIIQEGGRQVEWTLDKLPLVQADPAMMRVVVSNLLSNAMKYTRKAASPKITVTSTRADDEVTVMVSDNGVGFDMRHLDKLFGVFQRLHRSDEFEGTGIGLANVKRIVERHGGRVAAEGAIGTGATFSITLPIKQESP